MRSGPASSSSGPSWFGTALTSASGFGRSSSQNGRSPKSRCNGFESGSPAETARSGRCSARRTSPYTASVPSRARSRSTRCSQLPAGLPCSSSSPRLRPGSGTTSSAWNVISRTGSASARLESRSRKSSAKCSASREGATRPIATSVALSRCLSLRTKRCTPPERAARNPASWTISRLAAKSRASAWVTSAESSIAAAQNLHGRHGQRRFELDHRADEFLFSSQGEPESRARRGSARKRRAPAHLRQPPAQALEKRLQAAEELEAARDFEQHAVGKLERHAGRELRRPAGHAEQGFGLRRGIARHNAQPRREGERRRNSHARANAAREGLAVAGENAVPLFDRERLRRGRAAQKNLERQPGQPDGDPHGGFCRARRAASPAAG